MRILLATILAMIVSSAVCYPLSRWSGRLRLVAQPRPDRWHKSATPNTGGVGILTACVACFVWFGPAEHGLFAMCAAGIAVFGFLDDRLEFSPLFKFLGQAAAAIIVVASGMVIPISPWGSVNVVLTPLWIIGLTNAFNLIDNMDGLCGGVAVIVSASGAALALLRDDAPRALLFSVIAGASVGFLVFNHKPARIFLGDCGSMFLGFSLATLAIPRQADLTALETLYALPAFLYPLFDAVLVSVLRRRAGRPLSMGGRDHSSHRLVAVGMSERNAVWALWAIAAVCALCGPLAYRSRLWFLASVSCAIAGLAIFGGVLARVPGFTRAEAPSSLADARNEESAVSVG